MKNKLLTLASLLAAFNLNAIEIGPTGSGVEMSGFIDIYYQSGDDDAVGIGQVELMFDYASGPVSASVDYDLGGDFATAPALEEVIITYDFGNGFSATAGKMLTYMGFEAYDPINMYQYSSAYADSTAIAGIAHIYDAFATGVSIDYGSDAFSVGIWSSVGNSADFEYALAYTGVENLTVKAIIADYGDESIVSTGFEGKSTFWASYAFGDFLFAAEVANAEKSTATGTELDGSLFMLNYAVSDKIGLTLRASNTEVVTGTAAPLVDEDKFTISPSYVFNDNLSGLIEYSTFDQDGTLAETEDYLAVEMIYAF
ncbi:MAG: porin [Opitutales bacterium]